MAVILTPDDDPLGVIVIEDIFAGTAMAVHCAYIVKLSVGVNVLPAL